MQRTIWKALAGCLVLFALAVGGAVLVSPQARSQPPAAKPIGKLAVTNPLQADVVITQQYVGKLVAQTRITIRPLVSGFLEEVPVKEGQAVKKADVLFKILPTTYQAKLDIELAEVKIAQLELDNVNKLFKKQLVSPEEVALSQAKLAKAEAKAKLAQTELSFTTVRAPFDGKIGHIELQPGSLAKEGEALTSLTDSSVMRAHFSVSESGYLDYMARQGQGQKDPEVEFVLANGNKLSSFGNLSAGDFQNDTGTVIFRADIPNSDHLLLHGQSGIVLLHQTVNNALVIPQRSIFASNGRIYVYVVGKDGVVEQREIQVQYDRDDYYVIQKGLDLSDRILVEGIDKVHKGDKVETEFRKPEELLPNVKKHAEK